MNTNHMNVMVQRLHASLASGRSKVQIMSQSQLSLKNVKKHCDILNLSRDVSTGATGATAVAPKFSDTLTLFQPGEGGQILLTIGAVAPKFSLWLRPCS